MVHITHNISTAIEKSNKTKRKSFKMKINITMQLRAIAFKLPTPGGNPHDFSLGGREICIINIQVGV